MAERLTTNQQENKGVIRRVAGTGIEATGIIVGAEGLLSASLFGILAGILVWTGGAWLKNVG